MALIVTVSRHKESQDGARSLNFPWHSLLGGLIVFTLNSVAQPAGQVCGAQSKIGFQLRSSPIIRVIE